MSVELFDELEVGELAVEFEGQEPWDVLEWAIERFGDGLALSAAFQEGLPASQFSHPGRSTRHHR